MVDARDDQLGLELDQAERREANAVDRSPIGREAARAVLEGDLLDPQRRAGGDAAGGRGAVRVRRDHGQLDARQLRAARAASRAGRWPGCRRRSSGGPSSELPMLVVAIALVLTLDVCSVADGGQIEAVRLGRRARGACAARPRAGARSRRPSRRPAPTSSIVPTSTRTMWRMNVSASIQNSSTRRSAAIRRSARRARSARDRSRRGEGGEVVRPAQPAAQALERLLVQRAAATTAPAPLERARGRPRQHPVAVGARAGRRGARRIRRRRRSAASDRDVRRAAPRSATARALPASTSPSAVEATPPGPRRARRRRSGRRPTAGPASRGPSRAPAPSSPSTVRSPGCAAQPGEPAPVVLERASLIAAQAV